MAIPQLPRVNIKYSPQFKPINLSQKEIQKRFSQIQSKPLDITIPQQGLPEVSVTRDVGREISSAYKKVTDIGFGGRATERYDPRVGAYVSTSPSYGRGSTSVTGFPSIEESRRIREAKIKGGIFDRPTSEVIAAKKKGMEAYTKYEIKSEELGVASKKITELEKEFGSKIKRLEKGNIEGEYWTGSTKDYREYEKLTEDYNKELEGYGKKVEEVKSISGVKEGKEGLLYFEEEKIPVSLPFFKDRTLFEVPASSLTAGSKGGLYAQVASEGVGKVGTELSIAGGELLKSWTGKVFDVTGKSDVVSPRYYGKKIGEVIKRPSILFDKFKFRGTGGVIYDLKEGVARLATEEDFIKPDLKSTIPSSSIITKQEAQEAARLTGETAIGFGKYLIPYAGGVFFAADVEKQVRPYDYKPVEFAKAEPLQAGLLGATFLGVGALKGYKYLKTPQVLRYGDEIVLTTKGQRLFGGRLRLDFKEGVTYAPTKGKLRIQRQPVGKGQVVESIKDVRPQVLSLSDEPTRKLLETFITPIKDTKGFAREIVGGEKAIVSKPMPKRFEFSLFDRGTVLKSGVKIKYKPSGEEIIFRGLSPYTKAGKIERARVLDEFSSLGISPKKAKPMIALKQPRVIESKSDIKGLVIEGETGVRLRLKADEVTTLQKYEFADRFGTIKSRGGKPIIRTKELELTPSGKSLTEGEPIFSGTLVQTTPSAKLGKRTETSEIFQAVKKTGETEILLAPKSPASPVVEVELFKQVDVSKRVIPKKRATDVGTGDIMIRKPIDREIIDLDELSGLKKDVGQIPRIGEGSSKQFLKSLYKQDIVATGLGAIKPISKITKPTKALETISRTTSPKIESVWAGTGLYERSAGGTGITVGSGEIAPTQLQGFSLSSSLSYDGGQRIFEATKFDSVVVTAPKIKSILDIKPATRLSQEPFAKVIESTKLSSKELVKEKLETRQLERQATRQISKTIQAQKGLLTTTQVVKPPKPPKIKTPKIKKSFPKFSLKETETKEIPIEEDLFGAFVRKGGEDISIGKFTTEKLAEKTLFKTLRTELRASGFISKGGKKIDVNLFGTEFVRGKKDPFRIVEPKRRRIKRGTSEIFQIQQARGKSVKRRFL